MNSTSNGSDNAIPGKVIGVLAIVLIGLWIAGIFQILAGVIAGSLIVGALMMTVEQIPGFWRFAVNPLGKIVVLAATAWLTHKAFGSDTIIGMIALCWSMILKVIVISAKRQQMLAEGRISA